MVDKICAKNIIRTTVFAVIVLWKYPSYGQVSFQSVFMDGQVVSSVSLFTATLSNMSFPCDISIDGEVLSEQGELVISFSSSSFRLDVGTTVLSSAELVMRSFIYGTGPLGRSVERSQHLPGGAYRYCLRINAVDTESRDSYCDRLQMDDLLFLDLVEPWNGDTIDEVRPPLSWMVSGAIDRTLPPDVRITLCEMREGSVAAQALASERPLVMVPHVIDRTMPYPIGVQDLERGKCYAWQAERLNDARVVDRSEPWSFCVRKRMEPLQNKYVLLGHQSAGAIYEVVDDKVYFRYDEPYASASVSCSIYDREKRPIVPELKNDGTDGISATGARTVGVNTYELDLQPYGLRPGYYDLVVRDEKGRDRTLKLHVSP